jgi:tRNA(Ile)-lysidine synthase
MPERVKPLQSISTAEFERLMVPFAVSPGEAVAVAVSGGADSLALTLMLAEWAGAQGTHMGVRVVALTVDHDLRAGSTAEAEQVGAWLKSRNIDHHILTWSEGAGVQNAIQAKARRARYGLMAEWCLAQGIGRLFVAHHQGDQAETFVMRLKRASTLFGLAAMTPMRDMFGVQICRPLLDVSKGRLEATLKERGQAWIEDPSNTNQAFERVRTRALIEALSHEGVTPRALAGAAAAARRITEILDRAAQAFEGTAVTPHQGGGIRVDAQALAALPQSVRERVLSRLLHRVGGQDYGPAPAKLDRLTAWIDAADTSKNTARTLGGCLVRRTKGGFFIVPEPPRSVKAASRAA